MFFGSQVLCMEMTCYYFPLIPLLPSPIYGIAIFGNRKFCINIDEKAWII